jgi:hypothetical protein
MQHTHTLTGVLNTIVCLQEQEIMAQRNTIILISAFLDNAPSNRVEINARFGDAYRLHHQGDNDRTFKTSVTEHMAQHPTKQPSSWSPLEHEITPDTY